MKIKIEQIARIASALVGTFVAYLLSYCLVAYVCLPNTIKLYTFFGFHPVMILIVVQWIICALATIPVSVGYTCWSYSLIKEFAKNKSIIEKIEQTGDKL